MKKINGPVLYIFFMHIHMQEDNLLFSFLSQNTQINIHERSLCLVNSNNKADDKIW